MIIIIQIIFAVLNIGIGKYQAYRFDQQQKRINHTLWLVYYCIAAINVYWFMPNWYVVSALLIMHLPVFNTFLNYFRTPRRPLFYTHPDDPLGSKLDKLWGNAYPFVFFLTSAAYVALQFYIYG